MHIGVDISSITPKRTGIGNYTSELVQRLIRRPGNNYTLFFNSLRQPLPDITLPDNVRLVHWRVPGPTLLRSWQFLNWPAIETFIDQVDLFHSPGTYVPPQRIGVRATTIHDLSFLEPDAHVDPIGGGYLKWVCEHRLKQMDLVLVNSPATARAVRKHFQETLRVPREPKVAVTPLGVDERFFEPTSDSDREVVRRRYGLPEEYFLTVATQEPRKNLAALIRQYAELDLMKRPVPPLVIAGSPGFGNQRLDVMARELEMGDRVLFSGFVHQGDLPALYQQACAFVYPSKLEGFGLPVLEALASGIPVVSSMRVGVVEMLPPGTVDLFDVDEEESLAPAMLDAFAEWTGKERQSARREVARKFSWDECARLTLEAYQAAAAHHTAP